MHLDGKILKKVEGSMVPRALRNFSGGEKQAKHFMLPSSRSEAERLRNHIRCCECDCHPSSCSTCGCLTYSHTSCSSTATYSVTSCKCGCHTPGKYCTACGCPIIIICPCHPKKQPKKCCPDRIEISECAELVRTNNSVLPPAEVSCGAALKFEQDVRRKQYCCNTIQMPADNLPVYIIFDVAPESVKTHVGAFEIRGGPTHNISRWTLDFFNPYTQSWVQAYPTDPLEQASSNVVTMADPYVDISQDCGPITICLDNPVCKAPAWRIVIHEYTDPAKCNFSLCEFELVCSKTKSKYPCPCCGGCGYEC